MRFIRPSLLVGAAAFLLTASLFWPDHTLLEGYDWVRMHALYKEYWRATVLSGQLPLWNPFSGLGRPFLADAETATLYPLTGFYLAGLAPGLVLSIWSHFAIALVGMLRCARRLGCREGAAWFAALGFTYGTPLTGHLQAGQIQLFSTLCWLPLAIDLGCRLQDEPGPRRLVPFSLALALMFLAGHPPVFWVCAWGASVFLASRRCDWRSLAWPAAGALLAGALAAVQALPFLELVSEGNRSVHDPAFATAHGQAESWWSLLRSKPSGPYFYNWEYNLYMGLPLALTALIAMAGWRKPERRPVFVAIALFAILAAGSATPVLPWLAEHVPGWGAGRFPSRYTVVVAFGIALLAGAGLEHALAWLQARDTARRVTVHLVLGSLILLNAADAFRALVERSAKYSGVPVELRERQIVSQLRQAGLAQPGQPPPRLIAPMQFVRENSGLLHGYSTVTSFSSPMLRRAWDYLHAMAGVAPAPLEPINLPMAVYAADPDRFRGAHVQARWDFARQEALLAGPVGQRAWVSPAHHAVSSFREAHRLMADGHDFAHTSLVEGDPGLPTGTDAAATAPGTANIISFSPERIQVRSAATAPGLLVLAEAWFPGWTASIAGKRMAMIPVNGWMRAVAVPAGTHEVVIVFRPSSLWLGGIVTLLGLAFLVWLWHRASQPSGMAH